ncbi:hypothetical protein L226DRAFT_396619 [Lentinus tigrinus ALCF2SS1-7]|uniref:uncharacterized protein n=1 Tax=Lentinus tigrinus ALCF2SS1-7 TaxID=1328758 RepID=UPI0011660F61|nr:hypothetical protein L226DRAFT_396619 [Lentinus tigrinus ALCF2SS1-7]
MNVSFTKRDPINTTVIDDATGSMLFDVFTLPRWKGPVSTTTIRDAGGEIVAEYEHRLTGHDRVALRGTICRMSDWLPTRTWWLSDRILTTPDGQKYVWKSRWSNTFRLYPTDSKVPVVETHNATCRLFKPPRRGGMSIRPDLAPFLDVILLSFIVCERERRTEATSD